MIRVRPEMKSSLLVLMLAGVFGFSGCSSEPQTVAASPETVRNVSVFTVQRAEIPDLLEATGTVRAAKTSDLASQMMGNIIEIRVHEGERVQQGEVLALIDESQPRAAVERATAALIAAQEQFDAANSELALAQSTLKRYQNLYEKNSVSPQEFDEVETRQQAARAHRDMAQAGENQAKAALNQADTALGYTRIRAPFDGVLTAKKADPGTLASPGMPIFTIEDTRLYRLEAAVNESDLKYLRTGEHIPVLIDALGGPGLRGEVAEIVPAADPASRTFLVKIELPPDARLRSGLFGRAEFPRGERQALMVPSSAVVRRGQLQGVFVLDQSRIASLRYITLGKFSGSEVEVLAGLQEGERLVAKPGEFDLNGKRVEGN
jgi:RND family efflux transporter MFP subunit